jgi:antitoxin component of MazEF toxin-antitoxin module
MQTQTIFKAGNSGVVSIPKNLMEELGFEIGKKVIVDKNEDGTEIVIKKVTKTKVSTTKSAVNSEFKKWLKEATKEDVEILDQLA